MVINSKKKKGQHLRAVDIVWQLVAVQITVVSMLLARSDI